MPLRSPRHTAVAATVAILLADWLVRLDVGLAWFAALATLVLVPTDVAHALAGKPPGPLLTYGWRAAYWWVGGGEAGALAGGRGALELRRWLHISRTTPVLPAPPAGCCRLPN